MISPEFFFNSLKEKGISYYTGVPDSLLKSFCAFISDNNTKESNLITANEGGAIALAAGYYLSTGKLPLVYMQNSGLGNSINPLLSLADKEVYSIPMILLIGWRGEPGIKDEPQHKKQGKVTTSLLDIMEIPYRTLSDEPTKAQEDINWAISEASENKIPVAIVVRKNTFDDYNPKSNFENQYHLTRESAIKAIVQSLDKSDVIVSTTGKTSRELYECREELQQGHQNDFLTVGSMGHSGQIALGIAIQLPNKNVYCFDGDGSVIMHMGSLAITGDMAPKNYKHIIFNNGAHDSVGGQPTVGFNIDFREIARALNYKFTSIAETEEEVYEAIDKLKLTNGPCLLEIRVSKGARKNLGRPDSSPIENKKNFMTFLLSNED
jgi:phosphonopyruvate decarboxylase